MTLLDNRLRLNRTYTQTQLLRELIDLMLRIEERLQAIETRLDDGGL